MAIADPYSAKNVLIRKVLSNPADRNNWVVSRHDGAHIKLPMYHAWIECDSKSRRDSNSEFGPISGKHIIGEARYIVWPPWRVSSIQELSKFSIFNRRKIRHSSILTENEIYRKYPRPLLRKEPTFNQSDAKEL